MGIGADMLEALVRLVMGRRMGRYGGEGLRIWRNLTRVPTEVVAAWNDEVYRGDKWRYYVRVRRGRNY